MDWAPLWISLNTALPATIITFFLGIYAAQKVIKANTVIARIVDVIFTLPLVLPPTVAGFLLLMLLGRNGILGKPLMNAGIQIIFTRTAAVIAAVVISFPLMYRSAKAAFEQVDPNQIYAGRSLGISERRIFWRIIMPLALPGVASGAILAFARALGEFGATLMIAGNIPKVTQTMPLAIYMAILGGNGREAAIWVSVLIFLSFVMILLMNFFTSKGKNRKGRSVNHFTERTYSSFKNNL
jgi:molybdate transport system permease protein